MVWQYCNRATLNSRRQRLPRVVHQLASCFAPSSEDVDRFAEAVERAERHPSRLRYLRHSGTVRSCELDFRKMR